MTGVLAHGGIGGAVVEIGLLLTVVAVFVAIWRRERVASPKERKQQDEEA